MYLEFSKIENAEVYVSKGKGFMWLSHLDQNVFDGTIVDTRMGWQFYVVGVATNVFKGTF